MYLEIKVAQKYAQTGYIWSDIWSMLTESVIGQFVVVYTLL